ncbi:MAG TPA: CoA transferase, partial [Acidimicrobiales bacterium]|nr:CoA transferase [Acidimicrobiales bacterium]
YPNKSFDSDVPRSGNASGGGQPGWALRCKPGGTNDYIYVIIQPQVWEPLLRKIGREDLLGNPDYDTPEARLPRLEEIWEMVENWTMTRTKWEAFQELNDINVPCGPIFNTGDLIEDDTLADNGMIVEVDHVKRGRFRTVGSPLRLSDSPVEVATSPLLGEQSSEVLTDVLGYSPERVAALGEEGVI